MGSQSSTSPPGQTTSKQQICHWVSCACGALLASDAAASLSSNRAAERAWLTKAVARQAAAGFQRASLACIELSSPLFCPSLPNPCAISLAAPQAACQTPPKDLLWDLSLDCQHLLWLRRGAASQLNSACSLPEMSRPEVSGDEVNERAVCLPVDSQPLARLLPPPASICKSIQRADSILNVSLA